MTIPRECKRLAEVDPEESTLKLTSELFPVRGYKRIAVKAVDVHGNESTVVRDLASEW